MGNSNTVTQTIKKNQEYISDMNKIKVRFALNAVQFMESLLIQCVILADGTLDSNALSDQGT